MNENDPTFSKQEPKPTEPTVIPANEPDVESRGFSETPSETSSQSGVSVASIKPPIMQTEESKARLVAGGAKTVFVVIGRNYLAKEATMNFLSDLGVDPVELTTIPYGEGSPSIENLLDDAFRVAKGVVVLLTADDDAHLRECWADAMDETHRLDEPMFQPRMNVLFEIGLAWGKDNKANTILVEIAKPIRGKPLRLPSDISRLTVRMYDARSVEKGLSEIRKRLEEEVLRCELRHIEEGKMRRHKTSFLHAINERIEATGIEGLDTNRWIARTVSGVPQGVDYKRVNLGGPFRSLNIAVTSKSPYWRAGIKLEEPDSAFSLPNLVHGKSLLFHVGEKDNKFAVTGYYDPKPEDLRDRTNRHETIFVNDYLKNVAGTPLRIGMTVKRKGGKNLLTCSVLEEGKSWQPEPPVEIPENTDLLSNVYLVAWGDSETVGGNLVLRDFEVEFSDLKFEPWDE